MKKPKQKKATSTALATIPQSAEYWKARCLAAEDQVAKYQEAFGLLIAPFAQFMQEKITEMVEQAVDEAVDGIQVDSTVYRG